MDHSDSGWRKRKGDVWINANGYAWHKNYEGEGRYKIYYPHLPPEETKPKLKPDWDNKPEWADVWIEDKRIPSHSGWYKDNEDKFTDSNNRCYVKSSMDANETIYYPPKETKTYWSGNGYPPVGIKARTRGEECRVLAVDRENEQVAIQWTYNGGLAVVNLTCVKPSDLLREKWLDAAGDLLNNMDPLEDFLSALYDAMILGEIPIPKKESTNETTI